MRMKPILFNTPMTRAVDEDRKTATRRLLKPQPTWSGLNMRWDWGKIAWWRDNWNAADSIPEKNMPYKPGDILYVREAWRVRNMGGDIGTGTRYAEIEYKAGGTQIVHDGAEGFEKWRKGARWNPSIHMPKEAARIFRRVTNVRIERLQDITPSQCAAEGIELYAGPIQYRASYYIASFAALWDTTIPKADLDKYGWDANPWVWVIEFERCEKPEETK